MPTHAVEFPSFEFHCVLYPFVRHGANTSRAWASGVWKNVRYGQAITCSEILH